MKYAKNSRNVAGIEESMEKGSNGACKKVCKNNSKQLHMKSWSKSTKEIAEKVCKKMNKK